jgi:hypothetical protein
MSKAAAAGRAMILPLALALFIASYAATNMNVAITNGPGTWATTDRWPLTTRPEKP